ncbi:MAG: type II/IV secretion system protein [Candidatus Wallbacteria bacterium]|nr:type II/IV secretion system protein [Candidatus Wallbacteria bacterium]MBI4868605.1 type II/IV secretion system protein [Candidatus Wallbacteria bacterium]
MRKSLSRQFYEAGLLDTDQIAQVLTHASGSGLGFRESIAALGFMSREAVDEFVARVTGMPFIQHLEGLLQDKTASQWLPEAIARRYVAVPVSRFESLLTVAMLNPFDVDAVTALERSSGCTVVPAMSLEESILEALNRLYIRSDSFHTIVERIVGDADEDSEVPQTFDVLEEVGEESDDAPVVRLVNNILARAVCEYASDVHLEPDEHGSRVRFRVDGMLRETMSIPRQVHRAMVSRIKVMAEMDISERRAPQDGRIRVRVAEKEVDLRISTLPSIYGEKVVVRVLDASATASSLSEIGFAGKVLQQFRDALHHPNGLILVTGPTGSGKTTTLYTGLNELASRERNIVTLEDPVEYNLRQVNQIQVNPKAGITFATGLRSILRQDPDVIMVGEMRDLETAQMAIRSALTGHLVLSTLHTNDAAGAVVRLVEMGVEPYLVANSVICVVAQRLLRRLCVRCRQPVRPAEEELAFSGRMHLADSTAFYVPRGCAACEQTGFKGRLALLELLSVTDGIRQLLIAGKSAYEVAREARSEGMTTLWEYGAGLVASGLTSLVELRRVAAPPEAEWNGPGGGPP